MSSKIVIGAPLLPVEVKSFIDRYGYAEEWFIDVWSATRWIDATIKGLPPFKVFFNIVKVDPYLRVHIGPALPKAPVPPPTPKI